MAQISNLKLLFTYLCTQYWFMIKSSLSSCSRSKYIRAITYEALEQWAYLLIPKLALLYSTSNPSPSCLALLSHGISYLSVPSPECIPICRLLVYKSAQLVFLDFIKVLPPPSPPRDPFNIQNIYKP